MPAAFMTADHDFPDSLPLERLTELLEPVAPASKGLARLLGVVEALPLRYAPFFERLSALWDLSEADVRAALTLAREPRSFRATGIPGVRHMSIHAGPRLASASVHLLALAPGSRFPGHRHHGSEIVFVLEGSYTDAGRRVGPGEAQAMLPGSAHTLEVSTEGPCVATVVSRGYEFTSLPLRLLERAARWRKPRKR